MIWPQSFAERLHEWTDLRQHIHTQDLDSALTSVNNWWFRAPIAARYLHWDDHLTWPDPWQLLNDNLYCELARALGMLYTIEMAQHASITSVSLVHTAEDNLVLVNDGKYILNWAPGQLLNISSKKIEIRKIVDASRLLHLMG